MVSKIIKPNFENLSFFVSDNSKTSLILKIITLIDSINKIQCITAYFYTRFFLQF